jgi:hypothetical protein
MRRILFIVLGIIFGSIGLFTLYAAVDLDPDNTSPNVSTPGYRAQFDAAVRKRAAKDYNALDDAMRARILDEVIASQEAEGVREVALLLVRELGNQDAALSILRKHLNGLPPNLYEVGIASLAAIKAPVAGQLLDSLYHTLDTTAAAHTPLGGYGASTVVVSNVEQNLTATFQEQTRDNADYANAETPENTLFFPASPEWFASFPNADDVLEEFEDSRFMDALDDSPVKDEVWSLSALRPAAAYRTTLQDKMGWLAVFFGPERLVQDNLSVAKYGNSFLMVTFKDKNLTLAERLIGLFETLGKDFGIRRSEINGVEISSIRRGMSGTRLNYATVGNYVVASTDSALLVKSLNTFKADRGNTLGIDPVFRSSYLTLDQSGERDVAFLWFNPTRFFDMAGAEQPAARRLAILSRVLGKPLLPAGSGSSPANLSGTIASTSVTGDAPSQLWRYIVDVRSLGRNAVDSLAQLAGIDIGRQIMPYLGTSATVGYRGVEFLRRPYGYSNTGFEMYTTMALNNPPPGFDSTLKNLFAKLTSLVYTGETVQGSATTLWNAADTSTNDPTLLQAKLQPSFAVLNGKTLLIASTPVMLRRTAEALSASPVASAPAGYFTGNVAVDSFSTNAARYLTAYLMRTDRFPPEEVDKRIDPLRRAMGLYRTLDWRFNVEKGLRRGEAKLMAKQ